MALTISNQNAGERLSMETTWRKVEGPPASAYAKHSPKAFFSFAQGNNAFQNGYLGLQPSQVSGVFHVCYAVQRPLVARRIVLRFIGYETVRCADGGDGHRAVMRRELVNQSLCLWQAYERRHGGKSDEYEDEGSGTGSNCEAIVRMDLPFEFSLPDDLPATTNVCNGDARIEYQLQATILRARGSWLSGEEKVIACTCPIRRYELPPLHSDPLEWSDSDDRNDGMLEFSPAFNGIGYEVSVPQSTFAPSSTMVVSARIMFHDPRIALKKITVSLRRHCRISGEEARLHARAGNSNGNGTVAEETVRGDTIPMLPGPFNECATQIRLSVPSDLPCTVNTKNITVVYKVVICLDLGHARGFELLGSVRIDNLLSEDQMRVLFPP